MQACGPSPRQQYFKFYTDFVRKQTGLAKGIENVIRVVGFFIPASVGDHDVCSEWGYALSRALGYVNDFILFDGLDVQDKNDRQWRDFLGKVLAVLCFFEIVLEKAADKYGGETTKWKLIKSIERLKAGLRLGVLFLDQDILCNGGKVVPRRRPSNLKHATSTRPIPSNSTLNGHHPTKHEETQRHEGSSQAYQGACSYVGRRSGLRLSGSGHILSGTSDNRKEDNCNGSKREPYPLLCGAEFQPTGTSTGDKEKVEALGRRLLFAGEILNILRPLIFAELSSAMGAAAWTPLLASASVDGLGFLASAKYLTFNGNNKKAQALELHRRKMLWLLYLLRSPIFSTVTKPVLDTVNAGCNRVPILGGISQYGLSLLLYFQRHFFYISGSS